MSSWLIHNTFISDTELFFDQEIEFEKIKSDLEDEIHASLNRKEFNKLEYEYLVTILKGIEQ